MSIKVARTIDLVGLHAPCAVCNRQSSSHGDFTIGRDGTELVEVLFPVCPSCLYGDPEPIDRADRRVLFAHDLTPFLPSRRESM